MFFRELGLDGMKTGEVARRLKISVRTARQIRNNHRELSHEKMMALYFGAPEGERVEFSGEFRTEPPGDPVFQTSNRHRMANFIESANPAGLAKILGISKSSARRYLNGGRKINRKRFHEKGVFSLRDYEWLLEKNRFGFDDKCKTYSLAVSKLSDEEGGLF